MSYVLPINSYRSQQYANRLLGVNNSYSEITQLQQVQKVSDFKESYEDVAEQKKSKMRKEHDSLAASDLRNEVVGYVNPNPAKVSIKHDSVVTKGVVINAYI